MGKPITITVTADSDQVVMRIEDAAGGIPFEINQRIWSYMFSTAPKKTEGDYVNRGTPLAGFGVGLPLSRLYATYFGGSLDLFSLPGVGTVTYLHFPRLEDNAREKVPLSASRIMGPSWSAESQQHL